MNIKEQTDYHTLKPIRLETDQFEPITIALPWEYGKYGKVKYWENLFISGFFFAHREMNDFNMGLN